MNKALNALFNDALANKIECKVVFERRVVEIIGEAPKSRSTGDAKEAYKVLRKVWGNHATLSKKTLSIRFAEEIRKVMMESGHDTHTFAALVGVSPPGASNIHGGRTTPSKRVLNRIVAAYPALRTRLWEKLYMLTSLGPIKANRSSGYARNSPDEINPGPLGKSPKTPVDTPTAAFVDLSARLTSLLAVHPMNLIALHTALLQLQKEVGADTAMLLFMCSLTAREAVARSMGETR